MLNARAGILGVVAGIIFLFLATTITNLPLLLSLSGSGGLSLGLFLSLFGALATNMPPILAIVTVVNAVLFGLVVGFVARRREDRPLSRGGRPSVGAASGATLTFLGTGCVSCGAILFGGALPFLSGGALLSLLPLAGGEFALLGTLFLCYALYRLRRAVKGEGTCPA